MSSIKTVPTLQDLYFLQLCQEVSVPVEVHLVNFRVVVLNLGMGMVNEDSEVGQAALHREYLGKAADVVANAVHQTLYT